MDAGLAPARATRAQHRHELHTLTYVTLDHGNGGIVRNLNHQGIGVQVVGAVRPGQQLRVRFDLRQPRLRVETRGEVSWATRSGLCGIRFLDLSPSMARQIDEWIFGSLLESASLHSERTDSIFSGTLFGGSPSASSHSGALEEDDGLMVSAAPVNVIPLATLATQPNFLVPARACDAETASPSFSWDWLWEPLSGRRLVWTINALVIAAALLLFALVFLSITGEPPRWPLTLVGAGAALVAALYWGFFRLFGGASPGARLARMTGWDLQEDEDQDARFR